MADLKVYLKFLLLLRTHRVEPGPKAGMQCSTSVSSDLNLECCSWRTPATEF